MTRAIQLQEEIHIDRPVEEVFAAWSSAAELAKWFAPMATGKPDVELDFRVSGRYSIRMTLPGENVLTTQGVFKEILTNEKIVMTWQCNAFPDAPTLVTVRFLEDRARTTVRISHASFEFDDTCANHKHGWELCLAKLKDVLEA